MNKEDLQDLISTYKELPWMIRMLFWAAAIGIFSATIWAIII